MIDKLNKNTDAAARRTPRVLIARNIRQRRKAAGLTQGGLAEAAGLAQTAVSYIEREDGKSPTVGSLEAIATALKVPVWALLLDVEALEPAALNALEALVQAFLRLPDEGRSQLTRVADGELRYMQQD